MEPLGLVTEIVQSAGMGVSYVYKDLVSCGTQSLSSGVHGQRYGVAILVNTEAEEGENQDYIVMLKILR